MDATGDEDLVLQKSAGHLTAELWRYLPRYLRESSIDDGNEHGGRVRSVVRQSKTDQLIKLVGPPAPCAHLPMS